MFDTYEEFLEEIKKTVNSIVNNSELYKRDKIDSLYRLYEFHNEIMDYLEKSIGEVAEQNE
jgi:hypothetical protein